MILAGSAVMIGSIAGTGTKALGGSNAVKTMPLSQSDHNGSRLISLAANAMCGMYGSPGPGLYQFSIYLHISRYFCSVITTHVPSHLEVDTEGR